MQSKSSDAGVLHWSEFCRLNSRLGFSGFRNQKQNKGDVLSGPFHCEKYPGGMSIHYGSTLELQDLSNSAELPAGISFNLVFKGDAAFALAGKRFQLRRISNVKQPECCALILNKPEVMTRFLKRDNRVTKLNIFLTKGWLESRCDRKKIQELAQIFRSRNKVLHWRPCEGLLKIGESLLSQDSSTTLANSIGVESICLALAEKFIRELNLQVVKTYHTEASFTALSNDKNILINQLEKHWSPGMSLNNVALKMNMSVSTLQRRFKEKYNITVVDFLRQRKLEEARLLILENGASIGEAAYLAGYNHTSNFNCAFKRCFGMTPKELKDAHLVE